MITETIKTYEDVCAVDGVDAVTSLPYPEPQTGDEKAINGFAKAMRVARVLNEGWVPDWSNYDQYKYYPYFDMNPGEVPAGCSGLGFSFHVAVYAYSAAHVGSRLVFKSRELARFAGQQFEGIYREFMVIEE